VATLRAEDQRPGIYVDRDESGACELASDAVFVRQILDGGKLSITGDEGLCNAATEGYALTFAAPGCEGLGTTCPDEGAGGAGDGGAGGAR
jgi:hypothetical protein